MQPEVGADGPIFVWTAEGTRRKKTETQSTATASGPDTQGLEREPRMLVSAPGMELGGWERAEAGEVCLDRVRAWERWNEGMQEARNAARGEHFEEWQDEVLDAERLQQDKDCHLSFAHAEVESADEEMQMAQDASTAETRGDRFQRDEEVDTLKGGYEGKAFGKGKGGKRSQWLGKRKFFGRGME